MKQNMHGRMVDIYPLKDTKGECGECGREATVVVIELEDMKAPREFPQKGEAWLWCNMCDIGG